MKKALLMIIGLTSSALLYSQETVVFESGKDGYTSYRIPAIVKGQNGDLIAFAEGRVNDYGDYGNIDIVYKTSPDKGKTWGPLKVAVDYEKLQAGNVAPVVDLLDPQYPNGRLFIFYNTGNNHEGEVRNGKGLREVWYKTSTDNGTTWSEAVNITTQVHKPKQPQLNPEYNFSEDWRTYANTPGHGFQFVSGVNKGRIYVAANHNAGNPQSKNKDWNAHAFYSDDHGKTFKLSDNVPFPGTNESLAAQTGENTVYMTSRNMQFQPKERIISVSNDGGQTWASSAPDPNLPDPINQAAALSWKKGNKFMLAHINTAHQQKRDNLMLRLSKDGGKTWYMNTVVAKSPEDYNKKYGSYAAYSDIVLVDKKTIGVLYEKEEYSKINYVPVKIK